MAGSEYTRIAAYCLLRISQGLSRAFKSVFKKHLFSEQLISALRPFTKQEVRLPSRREFYERWLARFGERVNGHRNIENEHALTP
jgi:hypothetical protein